MMTLGMARLFSGPEDTWIRNENGVWVLHGVPSGPQSEDYTEPIHYILAPFMILATLPLSLILLLNYNKRIFSMHKHEWQV
ncbi:hypothetical protein ACFL6K_03530 [Candidatus Latescibacterota bacterium]